MIEGTGPAIKVEERSGIPARQWSKAFLKINHEVTLVSLPPSKLQPAKLEFKTLTLGV